MTTSLIVCHFASRTELTFRPEREIITQQDIAATVQPDLLDWTFPPEAHFLLAFSDDFILVRANGFNKCVVNNHVLTSGHVFAVNPNQTVTVKIGRETYAFALKGRREHGKHKRPRTHRAVPRRRR